jgi:hypothetical protein
LSLLMQSVSGQGPLFLLLDQLRVLAVDPVEH